MAIKFFCQFCGKKYNVKDSLVGKTARCACGHTFEVPVMATSASTRTDTTPTPVKPARPTSAPTPPKKPAQRTGSDPYWGAAGGLLSPDEIGPSTEPAVVEEEEEHYEPAPTPPPPPPLERLPAIDWNDAPATPTASPAQTEPRSWGAMALASELPEKPARPAPARYDDPFVTFPFQETFDTAIPAIGVLGLIVGLVLRLYGASQAAPNVPFGHLVGGAMIFLAVVFLGVVPLLLLGVWLAAKATRFALSPGSYGRMCGVVCLPAALGYVLEQCMEPSAAIGFCCLALLACFWLMFPLRPGRFVAAIGFEIVIVGTLAAIGVGVLAGKTGADVQDLLRGRQLADESQCAAGLNDISHAIGRYSLAHSDSQYPKSLDELVVAGLLTPDKLSCPITHERYVYRPPSNPGSCDSRRIIVYEAQFSHPHRRVLYAALNVGTLRDEEFQAALDVPETSVAAVPTPQPNVPSPTPEPWWRPSPMPTPSSTPAPTVSPVPQATVIADPPDGETVQEFAPDAVLLRKLEPPIACGAYTIRLPHTNAPASSKARWWQMSGGNFRWAQGMSNLRVKIETPAESLPSWPRICTSRVSPPGESCIFMPGAQLTFGTIHGLNFVRAQVPARQEVTYLANDPARNVTIAITLGSFANDGGQAMSLLECAVRTFAPGGTIASTKPAGHPASNPADTPVRVVWNVAGSSDPNLEKDHFLMQSCDMVRSIKFGRAGALIGVKFGPPAASTTDPVYLKFQKDTETAFLAEADKEKDLSARRSLTQKLGGSQYYRVMANKDDHWADVLIAVQDGRCVSYWFAGRMQCFSDFIATLSKARAEETP